MHDLQLTHFSGTFSKNIKLSQLKIVKKKLPWCKHFLKGFLFFFQEPQKCASFDSATICSFQIHFIHLRPPFYLFQISKHYHIISTGYFCLLYFEENHSKTALRQNNVLGTMYMVSSLGLNILSKSP